MNFLCTILFLELILFLLLFKNIAFIITCHPSYDSHGYPVLCPTTLFQRKDFRCLWIISGIVLNNNIFWDVFSKYSTSVQQDIWTGYLLKYLTSAVLNKKYTAFLERYNEHKTVDQIARLIELNVELDIDSSVQLQSHFIPSFF